MTEIPLYFYRTHEGRLRTDWSGEDPAGRLLVGFFESDLAGNETYYERLTAEAEKHAVDDKHSWRTSGNAFALQVQDGNVTVRPLAGAGQHESFGLPVHDFLVILRHWKKEVS